MPSLKQTASSVLKWFSCFQNKCCYLILDTDSIRLRRPRSTWPSNFYKLLAFNCNFLFYIALLQFFKTGNLAVVAYLYLLGPHSSTILLSHARRGIFFSTGKLFKTHCFGKEFLVALNYGIFQIWHPYTLSSNGQRA